MAARPKLTQERADRICESLRHGASDHAAASAAGIDRTTLYRWRRRGMEARHGPYRDLALRMEAALGEGEAVAAAALVASFTQPTRETITETFASGKTRTRVIERPPDAKGALAWLERRRPDIWNAVSRVAVGGDRAGGPVRHEHAHVHVHAVAGDGDWRALDKLTPEEIAVLGALRRAVESRSIEADPDEFEPVALLADMREAG